LCVVKGLGMMNGGGVGPREENHNHNHNLNNNHNHNHNHNHDHDHDHVIMHACMLCGLKNTENQSTKNICRDRWQKHKACKYIHIDRYI
jgi:ABC-type Zn2+ transport system substrate-binding protein/surface adhesin